MSFSLPRIAVPDPVYPDLAGAQQRGQQYQANQLAMLMQRQQFNDQQDQRNAFADYGAGLASSDPTKRQNVLSAMMQAAPGMGQQIVPMLRDERDQAAFAGLFGGGAPVAPPVAPAVQQAALPPPASGGPTQFLTQLRSAESGGNDAARNPRSSAAGRFQITNGTFAQYAPRLGLTEADRNNPQAQERIALAIQADGAQALGRPLQGWEQYGAHFLGLGGLRAFSNADPSADALATYTQAAGRDTAFAAFRSNPGLLEPGMTVGQVREALARRVPGGGSAPPAPPPPPPGGAAASGTPNLPSRERLAQIAQLAASGNQYAARYLQAVQPLLSGETQVERIRNEDGSERIVPRSQAVGQVSAPAPRDVQTTDVGAEGDRPAGRYVLNQDGTLGRRIGPVGNPGQQQLDNARAFRTELNGTRAATAYAQIEPAIMAIRQAATVDTRAADLDLVFAFANLLDPGSVVREGEALIVARTGGLPEQLIGSLSRVIGGAALGPETRDGLVAQAESRFATYEGPYRREVERVRRLAQRAGIDPDLVAEPLPAAPENRYRGTPARTPQVAPPPGAGVRVPPPPVGQRLSPQEAALLAPGTPFTGLDGQPRVRQ